MYTDMYVCMYVYVCRHVRHYICFPSQQYYQGLTDEIVTIKRRTIEADLDAWEYLCEFFTISNFTQITHRQFVNLKTQFQAEAGVRNITD